MVVGSGIAFSLELSTARPRNDSATAAAGEESAQLEPGATGACIARAAQTGLKSKTVNGDAGETVKSLTLRPVESMASLF
jgi:hypothetical protein